MEKDKLQEAQDFYKDRIKGWMIADLKKSIPAEVNFLTALGCFIYTEIIGILLPPLMGEGGPEKKRRFYRCFFRLKSENHLRNFNEFIKKETGKDIYENFRHSMAHKYFPIASKRKNGLTLFFPSMVARDGVTADSKVSAPPIFLDSQGRIVIAFRNFVDELENAVEKFYKLTFVENKPEYQQAAVNGIDIVLRGK